MPDEKNVKLLAWFNFFCDFRLYAPVAIIYFSTVSGSYMLGMGIFSIVMISSALFEVPTGIYSDMIGRRKTVILGAGASVLALLCYAIGVSFWILAVGAVFEGLSRSFYSGNNDALLHDSLTSSGNVEKYAHYLGKTSSMFQVALATSALLGGVLAVWSFPLIMWLSVIPQIICLFLSFQLVEPKRVSKTSGNIYLHLRSAYGKFLSNNKLRLLSVSSILGYAFGEAGFQFQSAFYATIWPLWAIGVAKTMSNIGAALSFYFSGRIIKRFGGLKLLIVDNVYNRVVNIFSTAYPSLWSPLMMSTTSIFFGVTSVTKNSLMQKEFGAEERATMGSLNSFVGSIVFGILALLLGLFADLFSPAKALLSLQIFQIINLWFYWKLYSHEQTIVT